MSAKDVRFSSDARDRMLRGVDILNNAVKAIDAHSRRHRGACVGIFQDRQRGGADEPAARSVTAKTEGKAPSPVNSTRETDFASPPSAHWIVVRNSVAAWGIEVLRWSERRARRNKG